MPICSLLILVSTCSSAIAVLALTLVGLCVSLAVSGGSCVRGCAGLVRRLLVRQRAARVPQLDAEHVLGLLAGAQHALQ